MTQNNTPILTQSYTSSAKKDNQSRKWILTGIITAILCGTLVGGWIPNLAVKFSILGELFLNSLMMIVVPLVMFSMIVGITGLGDIRKLGSIGKRTILYYLLTTGISVLIGITLVNIIKPGKNISPGENHMEYSYTIGGNNNRIITLKNGIWDKLNYDNRYMVILLDQGAQGIIDSISRNSITVKFWEPQEVKDIFYIKSKNGINTPFLFDNGKLISGEPDIKSSGSGVEINLSNIQQIRDKEEKSMGSVLKEVLVGNKESKKEGLIPRNIFNAMVRMDILPIIIFSLLFGATLSVLGKRGRLAIEVISILNDAMMKLIHWIMVISPIGIFGLIAYRIGDAGGFKGFLPELFALGKYSFTIIIGLAIHGIIVLPAILLLIGKRNPIKYFNGVAAALLNAFSTASSSATLPLTMEGVEIENGISNRTACFVLPLGATINMDGTALYEAVAAMFIAQVYGISMSPVEQTIIFLTATLAAIGAAGIPQAGLVTMVIVLKAVGLPIEGVGLILTIDWLLDRFRTTVNVWGDSIGAGVIETLEIKKNSNISMEKQGKKLQ